MSRDESLREPTPAVLVDSEIVVDGRAFDEALDLLQAELDTSMDHHLDSPEGRLWDVWTKLKASREAGR